MNEFKTQEGFGKVNREAGFFAEAIPNCELRKVLCDGRNDTRLTRFLLHFFDVVVRIYLKKNIFRKSKNGLLARLRRMLANKLTIGSKKKI